MLEVSCIKMAVARAIMISEFICYPPLNSARNGLYDALAERLRRWFKVPVRKGVGSIPTGVIM